MHNDIALRNLLLDDAGVPRIIDFGLCSKGSKEEMRREERELRGVLEDL